MMNQKLVGVRNICIFIVNFLGVYNLKELEVSVLKIIFIDDYVGGIIELKKYWF